MSCAPHPTRGRIQLSGHTEGLGSHPLEGRGAAPAPPSLLLGQDVTTSSSFPVAPRGCDGADPTGGGGLWHPGEPGSGWWWPGLFLSLSFPRPQRCLPCCSETSQQVGRLFCNFLRPRPLRLLLR